MEWFNNHLYFPYSLWNDLCCGNCTYDAPLATLPLKIIALIDTYSINLRPDPLSSIFSFLPVFLILLNFMISAFTYLNARIIYSFCFCLFGMRENLILRI